MDKGRLQEFFDWFGNAYLTGDLDWLSDVFVYPYSLFIDGQIRIEYGPEDTMEYFQSRRRDFKAIGAASITSRILEVGEKRSTRFPIRVNYTFLNARGEKIAFNTARYLCLLDERGRLRLESAELLRISIPFRDPGLLTRSKRLRTPLV